MSTNNFQLEWPYDERCATISVVDNNITEGNRSYQLILEKSGRSTVPVLLHPNTIPIIVIDNDGQGKNIATINICMHEC